MMVLHSSPASPFGRKVRLAAAMLGMSGDIEVVAADTSNAGDPIRTLNPLGKIPALVREDGTAHFDSRVILEYLDARAGGGRLVPASGDARFAVLTDAALADGMIDAALLQVYERRFREADKVVPSWLDYQNGKVERVLAAFEAAPPHGPRSVVDITLACGLGYLDFRFAGRWRAEHPRLVAWLAGFEEEVPGFAATRPPAA